jgi:hypothetical protein
MKGKYERRVDQLLVTCLFFTGASRAEAANFVLCGSLVISPPRTLSKVNDCNSGVAHVTGYSPILLLLVDALFGHSLLTHTL